MKSKIKIVLLCLFIVAIGISLFFHYTDQEVKDALPPEEAIDQVIDDIVIDEPPVHIEQGQVIGIKNEKKEWLIEAEIISIAEDRESTIFENIEQMIIFKDEEPQLTISATRCTANMHSKDMELNGNVVISNTDGDFLKGEKIFWHSEEQRLSSKDPVELQIDENYIIAGGLSTNMEMSQLDLNNHVTVMMKL